MANEEQLSILKQGVEVWNRWRHENPDCKIDLYQADLKKANLTRVDLNTANLMGAELSEADLSDAVFAFADLSGVNFERANLESAKFYGAWFGLTHLRHADLSKAIVGYTTFGEVDLSEVNGLEKVIFDFPCEIGVKTIQLSEGKIPLEFLRGCGLSDLEIEYAKLSNPDLDNEEVNKIIYKIYDLRATQALQISPLFISYSHVASGFVDKIGNRLTKKGIRFWRDIHDMKAGRIETQIDKGIRQNPTVLLVLTENSLSSDWVEHEVRTARGLEKEMGRDVLCPVALDDSWKDSRWPKRLMEQIMEYNILDFSGWQEDSKFDAMFRKLIDGLELFYKG